VPSRWLITLHGRPASQVPVTAPHAVVSRWLDSDHKAAVKPYAIGPLTIGRDNTDRTVIGRFRVLRG
jgi:hypothetical protein